MPALAKAGANYMNSQLIHMEAETNGYQEGIALDVNGLVSEGSGENIFVVRNGVLFTPPLANSALSGITRDSVLTIARHLGLPVTEQPIPRELLYIADEVFFTGTAAEVSPIRSIDRILIADGKTGEITKKIADEFFGIANGLKPDRFGWLTPVKVQAASETVSA
jgi:branched-chain amino acid aminotransferase